MEPTAAFLSAALTIAALGWSIGQVLTNQRRIER
jgi:hypothetical protein